MEASPALPTAEQRSPIDVRLRRLHLHYRLSARSIMATYQGKFAAGIDLGDTEQGLVARI